MKSSRKNKAAKGPREKNTRASWQEKLKEEQNRLKEEMKNKEHNASKGSRKKKRRNRRGRERGWSISGAIEPNRSARVHAGRMRGFGKL